MPYGVSLLLEGADAKRVRHAWDLLAAHGISQSMLHLDFPPHVTLHVYDDLRVPQTKSRLAACAERFGPIEVTFNRVAAFDKEGVLYAVPQDKTALRALHAALMLSPSTCHLHYRVNSWKPHCTLATGLGHRELTAARRLMQESWPLPFAVRLARLELVKFPPVERLWSTALRPTRESERA